MTAGEAPRIGERFNWFTVKVLVLLGLALITDSYDLQAASFAATSLTKIWDVPRSAFAPLFGAGLAGVFFGAPLFGWIGDRFGRKRAIIAACMVYGTFSLLTTFVENTHQFAVMRFLMGLGCGGALPNVIALATELAPHKRRGMLTSLIFVAMPLGGAIPGYVDSGLVPHFGWEIIFVIGGFAPILFALLIFLGLPESPAFLAARKARAAQPQEGQPAHAKTQAKPIVFQLFSREFLSTTLLLWLMFTGTLLTIYLLSSWLPLVLRAGGISATGTANVNFLYAIGGALSGIALSVVIDRIGLRAVAGLYALALLSVVLVAFSKFSEEGLAVTMFFCGFAVTGVQYALNVSAGLIYPSAIRSTGVGAALGIGRIGSVLGALLGGSVVSGALGLALGQMLGGFFDANSFAGPRLFLVPVAPLIIGTLATLVLMRLHNLRKAAPAT